jgi:hypothetical protein
MLLLDQGIWRLKNRVESYKFSCFPKVNNRKRSKILQNALIFMYPNIYRPPKIGHTKKPLGVTQNYAKLFQEHSKKLTKYLVFKHSKVAFYFWTKPFGTCKKKEKQHQIKEGWYEDIWRLKKQGRILKI